MTGRLGCVQRNSCKRVLDSWGPPPIGGPERDLSAIDIPDLHQGRTFLPLSAPVAGYEDALPHGDREFGFHEAPY